MIPSLLQNYYWINTYKLGFHKKKKKIESN